MKRIQLTDISGRKIDLYVSSTSIVEVREAKPSQAWHGIRANVAIDREHYYEVRETPDQIAAMLGSL